MTNIEKIKQLAGAVDADLQEDVESVILNAGIYVPLSPQWSVQQ